LIKGDWSVPPADLSPLTPALQSLGDQAVLREAAVKADELRLQGEQRELEGTLDDLRKRKRRYPAAVEALREAIRQAVPDTEPRVLCELIDIPDERWQNAVEGYLNSQRFDLLVPPAAFDGALDTYERRKQELRIESVGLVNSEALLRNQVSVLPGALADEVVTDDPAARAYVDRLLGRLMKCETEQELKRYPTAITPTCMTYRNHTARQIEFHTYAVPYIGSRALSRQIELKEQRLAEVRVQLAEITAHLGAIRAFLGLVRGCDIAPLQRGWEAVSHLPSLHEAICQKEAERNQIDVGALNALQRQIEEKDLSLKQIRDQRIALARLEEKAKHRLDQLQGETRAAESDWQARHRELEQYCREQPAAAEAGAVRYQEAARTRSNQTLVQNFTGNRQGVLTQAEKLGRELYELRLSYNHRYQFGGAPEAGGNDAYDQEYGKLAQSELPTYEAKIGEARAAAEQEFKEHFIFRLQENIRLARQEFDSLNRVLKEIPFGQDRYQFVATPDRGNRAFYDMIMDEYALEGVNLFSLHFREKHGETLDELFRLILDVPEERQSDHIRRYTDYRTYLEFDIRIHHANNETSTFSRVAREKSGGETQTPFYVAMIASFLQLYRPRQNSHTLRLMMFDEAFNRMDPDRAETMLQFIRALGLQVLAAAPTDKCEIITPHVETTLLVLRDGHRAWLEDYHQVLAV
ncbi:MAG TPA: SbcC/MukB-like Walker B domain-containing protein, partial [Symbiobacteriaceae bacterium]|nr:SbcC/MukB-like Walker B domain-containing protein [Symbiobacteriaceae bacterium]